MRTDRVAESDVCPAPGYIHDTNEICIKGSQCNQWKNGGQYLCEIWVSSIVLDKWIQDFTDPLNLQICLMRE